LDDQTTIACLRKMVRDFVSERDWQSYQDPKNLSISIAIEAAELLEVYQWLTTQQARSDSQETQTYQRTCEELSDVIIYCLALANALDIDISQAVSEKMITNALKYPTETCRGRLG
jgi:NTP pyrophosphatase (non-canonical NTP hydrolase)